MWGREYTYKYAHIYAQILCLRITAFQNFLRKNEKKNA